MDTSKLSEYLNAYKFNVVLPGNGEQINFKPISTFQLKKLASGGGDPDDALDDLINSCVTDVGFDVKNLPLQDRFFLLVELRVKSKGAMYNVTYKCDECKSQVIQSIDLRQMKVMPLKEDLDYKAVLDDNITVELSLLTRNTIKKAIEIVDKFIEDGTYDKDDRMFDETIMSYILSIKKIITPVGEVNSPDVETSMMLFQSGPLSFYDKIEEWYNNLDFGMDFKFDMICTHCQHKETVEVAIENFFN